MFQVDCNAGFSFLALLISVMMSVIRLVFFQS